MPAAHRYRPEVLELLERHGLRPRPESDPAAVYDLLKSLYAFEVRRLRLGHQEKERVLGPQPIEDLRRGLAELLDRYPVLRLPSHHWVERRGAAPAEEVPEGERQRDQSPDR